jgi:hypothetical protein
VEVRPLPVRQAQECLVKAIQEAQAQQVLMVRAAARAVLQ